MKIRLCPVHVHTMWHVSIISIDGENRAALALLLLFLWTVELRSFYFVLLPGVPAFLDPKFRYQLLVWYIGHDWSSLVDALV